MLQHYKKRLRNNFSEQQLRVSGRRVISDIEKKNQIEPFCIHLSSNSLTSMIFINHCYNKEFSKCYNAIISLTEERQRKDAETCYSYHNYLQKLFQSSLNQYRITSHPHNKPYTLTSKKTKPPDILLHNRTLCRKQRGQKLKKKFMFFAHSFKRSNFPSIQKLHEQLQDKPFPICCTYKKSSAATRGKMVATKMAGSSQAQQTITQQDV